MYRGAGARHHATHADPLRADPEQAGVGDETIRRCLVLLQSILSRAVEWQRILSNRIRAVRKPRTRRHHAVVPLAPETVEPVRAELIKRGSYDAAVVVSLLAYAGLRSEEALALPLAPADEALADALSGRGWERSDGSYWVRPEQVSGPIKGPYESHERLRQSPELVDQIRAAHRGEG